MARGLAIVEQARAREHPHAVAHAHDGGALAGLRRHPGDEGGVVVAVHSGHDDVVGTLGEAGVKRRGRGLRLNLQRRGKHSDRPRLRGQGPHLGHPRTREDAVGHHVVGEFRVVVFADDGDHRAGAPKPRLVSGQTLGRTIGRPLDRRRLGYRNLSVT